MDALAQLRRFWAAGAGEGAAVSRSDGALLCDGQRLSCELPIVQKGSGGGSYSVDAVWFFLANCSLKNTDYIRAARKAKLPFVSRVDQKPLLAYLKGEAEDIAPLQPVAAAGAVPAPGALPAATGGDAPAALAAAAPASSSAAAAAAAAAAAVGASAAASGESKVEDGADGGEEAVEEAIVASMKRELRVRTRSSVLRKPGASFQNVLRLFNELRQREKDAAAGKKPSSSKKSSSSSSRKKKREGGSGKGSSDRPSKRSRKRGHPIIVVPSAPSALLTLYNAQLFLQDARWVSTAAQKAAGVLKSQSVTVEHVGPDGKKRKFRVVDNVTRLSSSEWEHIVAVFAAGQVWQFKNWRWATPLDIFQRSQGLYMHFDDEAPLAIVKDWNVRIYSLSKRKRHKDGVLQRKLWAEIYRFMELKKNWLL